MNLKDIRVHDVVAISRKRRVAEDGSLMGCDWYEKSMPGVVMQVSIEAETVELIHPDGSRVSYAMAEGEKDYTFHLATASEVDYLAQVKKEIQRKRKELDQKAQELNKLFQWERTFVHQISFMGKLVRFVRSHTGI